MLSDDRMRQLRTDIAEALATLGKQPIGAAGRALLGALGYSSPKTADLPEPPGAFLDAIESYNAGGKPFDRERLKADRWSRCALLFQLTNDEIPALAHGQTQFAIDTSLNTRQIESFVFLGIELRDPRWSRTDLAAITRELNRRFPMPAIVLFHHDGLFSLAVIARRAHKRDGSKDVVERRVTVIKDVRTDRPHRAHLDILASLAMANLGERHRPADFDALYRAWMDALSITALNARFYRDLFHWYVWATRVVEFPKGGGEDREARNAVAVIRLLTRLIFIWFIKESRLVPEDFFDAAKLGGLLKEDPATHPDGEFYYPAILQNLFFATLNTEQGADRKWAAGGGGMKSDRFIHTLLRHKEAFQNPDAALGLFKGVPFLNGGLFECLDREVTDRDLERDPGLARLCSAEGKGRILRVDGFSRRAEARPRVPNCVFFGGAEGVDLEDATGAKERRGNVRGLIDILAAYKFTVDENTPLEEEVALDPELLGKVFENLLASYNEDTRSTARKKSGSFYTPREIVDYMVDEALLLHLEQAVPDTKDSPGRLRRLLAHAVNPPGFTGPEADRLVEAIESLRVIDPACGSGAFLMGMLAKLVHVLKRLDPDNARWRARNRHPLEQQLAAARDIPDPDLRADRVAAAEEEIETFDRAFGGAHHADYSRKLYLIEKCIHGVDLQPIAVQIAKLRFFIALIVSQEPDPARPNHGVTALPNLETKIVAANSLLRLGDGQRDIQVEAVADLERDLAEAGKHYFAARTYKTKRKWREHIAGLRDQLAHLLENDLGLPHEDARRLVQWNPFDQNSAADFFDPEWMFQIAGGFDVCVGNPPYVRHEKFKEQKAALRHYECASGTADLYVYFYERALTLLREGGAFAFITSNKWYRAKYGQPLRKWIARNTRLRLVIDFGDTDIFDALAYPTIVVATRAPRALAPGRNHGGDFLALNWTDPDRERVADLANVVDTEAFPVPQASLNPAGWQLEAPGKRRLLERIRAAGTPLGEYVGGRFYRGILTGLNDAFVISAADRDRLIAEDPRSAEIIKPFLRGRDVKRWRVAFADQYLIRIESSENKKHPWSGLRDDQAEKVFAKHYPAIQAHFNGKREAMESRYDQGKYFWELRACAYWSAFEKPKIIYPDIYLHQSFAWDADGYYAGNTTYFIPTDEKWLCGLLNSTLIEWFYEQIANRIQGGYLRAFSDRMQDIPIPSVTETQRAAVVSAVDATLATLDPRFERLINGLVYELFFPEELHARKLRIFDAVAKTDLFKLSKLKPDARAAAAAALTEELFVNTHPVYGMLFDLQALDVVRSIEGDPA